MEKSYDEMTNKEKVNHLYDEIINLRAKAEELQEYAHRLWVDDVIDDYSFEDEIEDVANDISGIEEELEHFVPTIKD